MKSKHKTSNPTQNTSTTLLLFVAGSTIFLDYWEYSRSFYSDSGIWQRTLSGTEAAPAQYRIGVIKAAEFLSRHGHFGMRHALGLTDFCCLTITIFALRSILTRSSNWQTSTPIGQWFGIAAFVVVLQYNLLWLDWFQRPETLSTALLLALCFYLTSFGFPVRGVTGRVLTALALLMLGLLQGLVRADVGVTFHLGVAIACLFFPHLSQRCDRGRAASGILLRWPQFLASLGAAVVAAMMQMYLMRVRYPHARFGATGGIHLKYNIIYWTRMIPFALFFLPSAWTAVQVLRRRFHPSLAEAGLLLGAVMFLGMWCTFGKMDEVRIFLPYALAFTPMAVVVALTRLISLSVTPQDMRAPDTVS